MTYTDSELQMYRDGWTDALCWILKDLNIELSEEAKQEILEKLK